MNLHSEEARLILSKNMPSLNNLMALKRNGPRHSGANNFENCRRRWSFRLIALARRSDPLRRRHGGGW